MTLAIMTIAALLCVGTIVMVWRLDVRKRREAEAEAARLRREREVSAISAKADVERDRTEDDHAARRAAIAAELRVIEERSRAARGKADFVRLGGEEGAKSLASLLDREKP